MAQLTPQQLRQFARLGAEARLAQLDAEIAAIKTMYPDLAHARAGGQATAKKQPAPAKRRKRYRMSPEARRAAAERMRKYWAERRGGKAEGQQAQAAAQKKAGAAKKTAKRKRAGRKRAKKS